MKIHLSNASPDPIYEQIVRQVRAQILSGDLAVGIFYFLPFVYLFGTSKGMLLFAVTLILFPAGALAWQGASGCLEAILAFGNRALDQPTFALGLGASGLIFGLVSLRLSVWSYRRRGI